MTNTPSPDQLLTIRRETLQLLELRLLLESDLTGLSEQGHKLLDDIQKALSAPASAVVPEGWKLVPVEPTEEMLAAAQTPSKSE